jgi:hypothetical protein
MWHGGWRNLRVSHRSRRFGTSGQCPDLDQQTKQRSDDGQRRIELVARLDEQVTWAT